MPTFEQLGITESAPETVETTAPATGSISFEDIGEGPVTVAEETPADLRRRFSLAASSPIADIQTRDIPSGGPGTVGPSREEAGEAVGMLLDLAAKYPSLVAEKPGETLAATAKGAIMPWVPGTTYMERRSREKGLREATDLPIEELRRRVGLRRRPYMAQPGQPSAIPMLKEIAAMPEEELRREYAQEYIPTEAEESGEAVGGFGSRMAQSYMLGKLVPPGPGKIMPKAANMGLWKSLSDVGGKAMSGGARLGLRSLAESAPWMLEAVETLDPESAAQAAGLGLLADFGLAGLGKLANMLRPKYKRYLTNVARATSTTDADKAIVAPVRAMIEDYGSPHLSSAVKELSGSDLLTQTRHMSDILAMEAGDQLRKRGLSSVTIDPADLRRSVSVGAGEQLGSPTAVKGAMDKILSDIDVITGGTGEMPVEEAIRLVQNLYEESAYRAVADPLGDEAVRKVHNVIPAVIQGALYGKLAKSGAEDVFELVVVPATYIGAVKGLLRGRKLSKSEMLMDVLGGLIGQKTVTPWMPVKRY